jgi:type IV secretory pathway TrbD component
MPTVKQEAQTSKIQDDLETSIALFERKAAILFGVIASVVTFGLILWYWIEVFRLTVHSLLYWTCTMCIFYQLFRLYAGIMWLYRRLRGLNRGNILKETEEYVQDFTLFVPRMWGFQLGQGPLFGKITINYCTDRLLTRPRIAARRVESCKASLQKSRRGFCISRFCRGTSARRYSRPGHARRSCTPCLERRS